MKLLIAAGGTGGHIFPGIAVAHEILSREPDSEILFVGTARGLETKLVPANGFQLSLINSAGLKNVGFKERIKGLTILPKSLLEARQIIRQFRPHVAVGAGGYVSGPVLLMAAIMGIPTLIMDSNALPGFTNRVLARFVDKAALTFEEATKYFGSKAVVTGNPVRQEFFDIKPRQRGERLRILVFGGSQGSRAINNALAEALPELAQLSNRLEIMHQTGEADFERILEAYKQSGLEKWDVQPFINNMPAALDWADLAVCRAGATTCAELAAAGRAALMIPLPTAADDHQRRNAEAMQNAGAARMILQSDLSGMALFQAIKDFIENPKQLDEMQLAARTLAKQDAAKRTADLIEELRRNV